MEPFDVGCRRPVSILFRTSMYLTSDDGKSRETGSSKDGTTLHYNRSVRRRGKGRNPRGNRRTQDLPPGDTKIFRNTTLLTRKTLGQVHRRFIFETHDDGGHPNRKRNYSETLRV